MWTITKTLQSFVGLHSFVTCECWLGRLSCHGEGREAILTSTHLIKCFVKKSWLLALKCYTKYVNFFRSFFHFTLFNTTVGTIWHQIVWFLVKYCFKDQLPVFSVCVLVVIWDCLGATVELWAVLGLPWLQRNLFLAAVRWIGPVSQFRPCMPNTDPLITPHKVSHSLSLWLLLSLRLALSYSSFHRAIITRIVPCLQSSTRLLFFLPAPSFCPSCPSAHLAFPSLFGQKSPRRRFLNGTTVSASLCVLFQSLECVSRGRGGGGGGGRGSGLRMWARCLHTLIPPP